MIVQVQEINCIKVTKNSFFRFTYPNFFVRLVVRPCVIQSINKCLYFHIGISHNAIGGRKVTVVIITNIDFRSFHHI